MAKRKNVGVPSGLSYRKKSRRFCPSVVLAPVDSSGQLNAIIYNGLEPTKVDLFFGFVTEWVKKFGPENAGEAPEPSSVETFVLPVRIVGVPGSDVWEIQEGILESEALWVCCPALSFSFGAPRGTSRRSITEGALIVLKHHATKVKWDLHEVQA